MMDEVVSAYVAGATADGYPEDWDLDQLWTALRTLYPVSVTVAEVITESGGELSGLSSDLLLAEVTADAEAAYDAREAQLGSEVMRELERRVVLSVLDRKWREHLYEMDYLQEGIGLRAMAQGDPLVEYQGEGFNMFNAMLDAIKEESVRFLFTLEVQVEQAEPGEQGEPEASADAPVAAAAPAVAAPPAGPHPPALSAKGLDGHHRPDNLQYSAPTLDTPQPAGSAPDAAKSGTATTQAVRGDEPGRNAPCPCGSGKKYKRCRGAPTPAS